MKWSRQDVERFKTLFKDDVQVDSVEGNILLYSYDYKGKHWDWKARLLRGGKGMSFTVHFPEDNADLFD